MNKKVNLLIYFLCISKLLLATQKQDGTFRTTHLSPTDNIFSINESIYYFEDAEGKFTFEDIIEPEFAGEFTLPVDKNLNFGYTHSTYWARIHIKNLQPQVDDWLLEINNHFLDSIDFFYLGTNKQWVSKPFGDLYPFQQREWPARTFIIPLELQDTVPKTYYFRFKGDMTMLFPMNIGRENSWIKAELMSEIYYGIFFGIMLLLIINNTLLYFSLRDISSLHYVFLILSTTMFTAFDSGHLNQYVLPNSMEFSNNMLPSLIVLASVSMVIFTRSFLNLKKYYAKLDKVLYYFTIVSWVLVFLLYFTNYHFSIKVATYHAQISIISSICCGILCLIKGNKSARLFILAFTIFALGGIAVTLIVLGVYGHNFISQHGMDLGAISNGIILSLALVNNYKISRTEKEKAQEEVIQMREKANVILEQTVKDRTLEISEKNKELLQQKEEVETQMDEIEAQRDLVTAQKDQILEQTEAMTESIQYASRIQNAILPPEQYFHEILNDVFILFKPRDIVSGDFYWIKQVKEYVILAAADCTGHGVPGALMSMLGISYLNEIVQRREITQANQVLHELRRQVRNSLRQHGQAEESKDGIDMAVCVIDEKNQVLQYAGANNPIYLIRNNNGTPELKEFKADRMPLGYYQGRFKPFTNNDIHFEFGDMFYLFSDGFVDQKGGKECKKFLSKNFKKHLLEIHQEPMREQKNILDKTITNWMGDTSQIDDILVIGVRV
jgi:serine phosphatase RsbU (regulator of sigma subunit)